MHLPTVDRLDAGTNARIRAGGGPNEILQPSASPLLRIDLHVKTMYVCILHASGHVRVRRNVKANPEALLETLAEYRDDLVVVAECMFTCRASS